MFFHVLNRLDHRLFQTLKLLTGLTFAAVVLSVILGIFFRYVLKSPLAWVEEFSRLNFIWSTFMGACVATRNQEHLRIQVFSHRLHHRGRAVHDITISLFSLAFMGAVIWYGPTVYEALSMQNYAGMPLSQKWQAVPVIIGGLVMSLYFLAIIVDRLMILIKKERTA
jgi:TRAP-type transport system small permease protein